MPFKARGPEIIMPQRVESLGFAMVKTARSYEHLSSWVPACDRQTDGRTVAAYVTL